MFLVKTLLSALLIAAISEIGKRSSVLAALVASIPMVSVLAMCWMYYEGKDMEKISQFAKTTPLMVIPSFAFFFAFAYFARYLGFVGCMAVSLVIMFIAYYLFGVIMQKMGFLI